MIEFNNQTGFLKIDSLIIDPDITPSIFLREIGKFNDLSYKCDMSNFNSYIISGLLNNTVVVGLDFYKDKIIKVIIEPNSLRKGVFNYLEREKLVLDKIFAEYFKNVDETLANFYAKLIFDSRANFWSIRIAYKDIETIEKELK
jgi:hypothetical protein